MAFPFTGLNSHSFSLSKVSELNFLSDEPWFPVFGRARFVVLAKVDTIKKNNNKKNIMSLIALVKTSA
jgi:hypothetical protein